METPNLEYIDKIANGSEILKAKIIKIVREELSLDSEKYYELKDTKDLKNFKVYIHRIKNKMTVLGLIESYKIASNYEKNIENVTDEEKKFFENTLAHMIEFIDNI
ncbi:hypothetical protein [Polaribacter tangerinus]|uniref:hypothetical protein n=1 Tax=Polaribacter tangerinus TaxID=1920034 RepID=UPI000B4BB309|nr:hypothetical protein [Polaribacter tangerinus]